MSAPLNECEACDGLGTVTLWCKSSIGPDALSDWFYTDCFHCDGTGEVEALVDVERISDERIAA